MIIDIFYLNMCSFKFKLMQNEFWVDVSYSGSLFASLWTFAECTLFKCHKRIVKSST
jgi:hypothetical protein